MVHYKAMKAVILIPDGAADRPCAELGGKTPLQAAQTPNLDRLAVEGRCGMVRTIPAGFTPGSEIANLVILGYDPAVCFQGRGVLEAAAMGVDLSDDDVALRCNLICIEDGRIKNHSAGHISTPEAADLIQFLQEHLGSAQVSFHPGVSYRHLLVLKGGFSPHVDCHPPHAVVNRPAADLLPAARTPEAEETAGLLRDLIARSREILPQHAVNRRRVGEGKDPANSIWPWSAGRRPQMETLRERFGISGAVITAVDLIRGIGRYAGLVAVRVEGATGLYDTNYEGKADACLRALADNDLVYVHVEAPDEAGHEGDARLKVRCIEEFDRRLVGRILAGIDLSSTTVAVLPDHATPVCLRTHAEEPVPCAIRSAGVCADTVRSFDEKSCAAGSLGLLEGDAFIRAVLAP